ncbi:MAG: hypothetical protein ABI843_00790 [Dokdonella sp.]
MARILERMFGGLPVRSAPPIALDDAESEHVPVRYRPRLVTQLLQEHETLRMLVRALLDACRGRDEDARILGLRDIAATFRRLSLTKSVHLYPYLRWGLENDRMAVIQFKALQAEVQRSVQSVESILCEYLEGPWLSETRRRLIGDIARLARLLGQALKQEEANVFPLYLPPGQYRHVRDA